MPARNSVRCRKGEEPPEKLPASKVPSRATPPLEMMTIPAVIPSTPVTRSTTLAKKTGECKTDQNKPPACSPQPRRPRPTSRGRRHQPRGMSRHLPPHRQFLPPYPPQINPPPTSVHREGYSRQPRHPEGIL
jgi:hypothetical protein